jgi:Bacterial Ig-like domain
MRGASQAPAGARRSLREALRLGTLFGRAVTSRHGSRIPVLLLAAAIAACPAIAAAATESPEDGGVLDAGTAPDTVIDVGPSGPTNVASPSFNFSSPQGASRFWCRLDAAPFEPCASPRAYEALADGTHTFRARAGGATGEVDPTPAARTFVIDTEAPAVSVDSGPTRPTSDPRPAFAFSSPDETATFDCSIDTGTPAFRPCSGDGVDQPAEKLEDDSYTFRVQATDPAGNATVATRPFTIDTTAPTVAIDSGPSGPTDDPRPVFEFSSPEEDVTFACSIDTGKPGFRPCSGDGVDQPAEELDGGFYTFRVQATDEAGNTTTAIGEFKVRQAEPVADASAKRGRSAPKPLPAWYMTARSRHDLERMARNNACAFARRQPNRTRVLLFDFGKPERRKRHWGTELRTGPHFTNLEVLNAMKAGSRIYRSDGPCYERGSVRITFGNTNNLPERFSRREARTAGRKHALMSKRLGKYQRRKGRAYRFQGFAVAGDLEPQWSRPKRTKALVDGATRRGRGGLYFNYGAASECPPESKRCSNGWDYKDLARVSFGGVRRALPEVYRRVHAKQWTRVRRTWNRHHRKRFCFFGATATPGFPVSIRGSWRKLAAKNKCVKKELVNIRDS